MCKFYRNRIFLGLMLLVLLLSGGCANQQAKDVLAALQENNENYRKGAANFEIELLKIAKAKVIKGLETTIAKEKLDLQLKVYQGSEKVLFGGIDHELELFEKAMAGPIERMQEERKVALASNNKQKELELAVQVSATLALYGKEQLDLINSTKAKVKTFREDMFEKIDKDFKSLEAQMDTVEKDLDAEINTIIERIKSVNEAQSDKEKLAYDQLNKYLGFPLSAVKSFLKGLVGEKTFQTLQKFSFNNKPLGDLFLDKAEKEVDGFYKSINRKTDDLIDEINKKS